MNPPIKELMDDHQVILRMLGVLRGLCARLEQGQSVEGDDLEAAVDFIKIFADYCHHGKEEDLLFPAMEEAGIPSRRAGYLALVGRLAAAYPDPEPVRPAGRCH